MCCNSHRWHHDPRFRDPNFVSESSVLSAISASEKKVMAAIEAVEKRLRQKVTQAPSAADGSDVASLLTEGLSHGKEVAQEVTAAIDEVRQDVSDHLNEMDNNAAVRDKRMEKSLKKHRKEIKFFKHQVMRMMIDQAQLKETMERDRVSKNMETQIIILKSARPLLYMKHRRLIAVQRLLNSYVKRLHADPYFDPINTLHDRIVAAIHRQTRPAKIETEMRPCRPVGENRLFDATILNASAEPTLGTKALGSDAKPAFAATSPSVDLHRALTGHTGFRSRRTGNTHWLFDVACSRQVLSDAKVVNTSAAAPQDATVVGTVVEDTEGDPTTEPNMGSPVVMMADTVPSELGRRSHHVDVKSDTSVPLPPLPTVSFPWDKRHSTSSIWLALVVLAAIAGVAVAATGLLVTYLLTSAANIVLVRCRALRLQCGPTKNDLLCPVYVSPIKPQLWDGESILKQRSRRDLPSAGTTRDNDGGSSMREDGDHRRPTYDTENCSDAETDIITVEFADIALDPRGVNHASSDGISVEDEANAIPNGLVELEVQRLPELRAECHPTSPGVPNNCSALTTNASSDASVSKELSATSSHILQFAQWSTYVALLLATPFLHEFSCPKQVW